MDGMALLLGVVHWVDVVRHIGIVHHRGYVRGDGLLWGSVSRAHSLVSGKSNHPTLPP